MVEILEIALWYITEIEEKKQDEERSRSRAIFTNNK